MANSLTEMRVNYPIEMMWDYPMNAHKSKELFLRDVRKRWEKFKKYWWKAYLYSKDAVGHGCAYYPPEVYEWMNQFDKMDELMSKFYKKA